MKFIGVRHIRVTPYHPRGAGAVERTNRNKAALQAAKGVDRLTALRQFLLSNRSTPHATTGRSPAELIRERQLMTRLHAAHQSSWGDDVEMRVSEKQARQKSYFDQAHSHFTKIQGGRCGAFQD